MVLAPVLVGAMAAAAEAQQTGGVVGRPYRGLFGGGVDDAGELLTAGATAGGGYAAPVSSGAAGVPARATGQLGGSLRYDFVRPSVTVQALGSSLGRYSSTARWLPGSHQAGASAQFALPVTSRTTIAFGQRFSYRPLHLVSSLPNVRGFNLAGDDGLLLDPALAGTRDVYASVLSMGGVAYQLSRRNTVAASVSYMRGGLLSDKSDLARVRAGVDFSRAVTQGLSVRLGYAFVEGTHYTEPRTRYRNHDIVAGLDFNRALTWSITRETTVSFAAGSTVVSTDERTRLYVTGRARLAHEIGRSWTASLAYVRGVDVRGDVQAPVFSDALVAGLDGLIGRRLQYRAAAGTAIGNVGVVARNHFRSYYATTGLVYGLTRHVGLDVYYTYYRSRFDSTTLLLPGVPDFFDRQSVRASLTLWAPLLYRPRRP